MKRALIALVAVGFVVTAISIARANSGDEEPSAKPADVSRKLDRDITKDQTKQQAEQVLKAQEELERDVDEFAKAQSHTLIVTIREEQPGTLWVVGKADGKPACVPPPNDAAAFVEATPLRANVKLDEQGRTPGGQAAEQWRLPGERRAVRVSAGRIPDHCVGRRRLDWRGQGGACHRAPEGHRRRLTHAVAGCGACRTGSSSSRSSPEVSCSCGSSCWRCCGARSPTR